MDMNELVKLKKKLDITKWLDSRGVEGYIINEDFTVDAQDVYLENDNITHIPFQFRIVEAFSIRKNKLTSTKGIPKRFEYLDLSMNSLTNLLYVDDTELDYVKFEANPCTYIYEQLGLTTQAHFEALKELEPNPKETLAELKLVFPKRYKQVMSYAKEVDSFLKKLK